MGCKQVLYTWKELHVLCRMAFHPPDSTACHSMGPSPTEIVTRGAGDVDAKQTLLCTCKLHGRVWPWLHHNAVQSWLAKAIRASATIVPVNHTVPACETQLCLDIIMADENRYIMVVNSMPLSRTCKWKLSRYPDTLRSQGYELMVIMLIIGVLRAWGPISESTLHAC